MIMRYADSHCAYTEGLKDGEHIYIFTGLCIVTKKLYSVTVLGSELFAYRQGAKLQDAFQSLSAGDREFLFSGFSPEGWAKTFPAGEDDDDDESPRFVSTPPDIFKTHKVDTATAETKCPLCEAGHPTTIKII
jgi:hypothetical protein